MANDSKIFFDKHTNWLERNREFISTILWEQREAPPEKDTKEAINKFKKFKEIQKSDAKNDFDIVSNIIKRLKQFLKLIEGEKHFEYNKKRINTFLEPIKIYLNKIEKYLEGNNLLNYKLPEYRSLEIVFQDSIFNFKVKIEDLLDETGVYLDNDSKNIKFFRDVKASLIMRQPLVLLNEDIKLETENLNINWFSDISQSNEMYINMKQKDIPKWNYKKHYFEQEKSTIEFWNNEYQKICKGIYLGGYFIHPWLYFHLNFFRTRIPQRDGQEPTIQPSFRDNEWFFVENLKSCIDDDNENYYKKAMLLYGTRRFGKSVILASVGHWKIISKYNSYVSVVGGSSSDLSSLTSKIQTSMKHIEKPFYLDILKQNWENGETIFGIKEDLSNSIRYSTLIVQNLEGGSKIKSQAPAGLDPSASLYDEIGKYSFLEPYLAALPSFKTPYGFKCLTLLAGTGGHADLSKDAVEVLSNPEAYSLLAMDWDLLESKIDPEHITWKRRNFATFFPGQMAYEKGFQKNDIRLSKFLNISIPKNEDIFIGVTKWKENGEVLKEELKKAKEIKGTKGKLLEQQKRVQNPLDPEDCLIALKGNIMPSEEAKRQRLRLIDTGDTGRKVFLEIDKVTGRLVEYSAEDMELATFPHQGGYVDAPITLFTSLPDEEPPYGLFVAGLDDYKHEDSNGDSIGSITIYKRNWLDSDSNTIVATLHTRPNPRSKFDKQCYYLLKAFNAVCFPENEDNNFKHYLDKLGLTELYLGKGIDFATKLNLNTNFKRTFGWSPTEYNIRFGYGLVKKYLEEDIVIKSEYGDNIVIQGIERIKDIGLLEEIENFREGGNYDRLRSFMGALMYSHYLDIMFVTPSQNKQNEREKPKPRQKKRLPFLRGQGFKPFRT